MSGLRAIDFARYTPFAESARGRFGSGLSVWIAGPLKSLLNRLRAHELRTFDDRLLDDVGLTRADLEDALASTRPFTDPTPDLARAARARARHCVLPQRY